MFIKLKNGGSYIFVGSTAYVSKNKISYIDTFEKDSDGYIRKKTYIINFHLDNGETVEWKTYDEEEFNKKILEVIENEK